MLGRARRVDTVAGRRLLGLALIVGAVLVVLLAVVRPNPFRDTKTIYARLDNIQGLGRIDRNIRVAGANVGQIGSVVRDGDDAIIALELDSDISVHKDARVELRPHTLFEGSAFVDLHPGSPSAPELEDGALIPLSQTHSYTTLDQATRVFNAGNRKLLQDLIGSTDRILHPRTVGSLRRTLKTAPGLLRNLEPAASALQGPHGVELAGAIRGFARTTDAIGRQSDELAPLVARTNRTLAAVGIERGRPLDATLAALPGTLEELDRSSDELKALLGRVVVLADKLRPAARALAPLLRRTRPLLRRATPIIRQATPLIGALRTILARTSRAAPALRRAIVALRPGQRVLRQKVLPALNRDTLFGLPAYAQLPAVFAGGAGVGRVLQTPEQARSFGHIVRTPAYFDPAGNAGSGLPSCANVALINPRLAQRLEQLHLCRP